MYPQDFSNDVRWGGACTLIATATLLLAQACTAPPSPSSQAAPIPALQPAAPQVVAVKPEPVVTCDVSIKKTKLDRTGRSVSAPQFKFVTGPERQTDFQIARDLAKFVAPCAGIRVDVVASKGSTDNMHRLHTDPNVKLAIVNLDVFQAFLGKAAAGDKKAARIVRPVQVVTPLYTEEIYFVVRSDSPLIAIHDVKGKRINLGPIGSGSVLSVAALYQRMFDTPIPASKASFLSDEDSLIALTFDRTIDVMVVIAGQPAKLFAEMKPEARNLIKLLRFEPDAVATRSAQKPYFPAVIHSANYPSWLDEDVPTLAVMSVLVTSNNKDKKTAKYLGAFARSLCQNIDVLQAHGHLKWREVELDQCSRRAVLARQ
jgi:TRAP transporter TAXI family solute receptor